MSEPNANLFVSLPLDLAERVLAYTRLASVESWAEYSLTVGTPKSYADDRVQRLEHRMMAIKADQETLEALVATVKDRAALAPTPADAQERVRRLEDGLRELDNPCNFGLLELVALDLERSSKPDRQTWAADLRQLAKQLWALCTPLRGTPRAALEEGRDAK